MNLQPRPGGARARAIRGMTSAPKAAIERRTRASAMAPWASAETIVGEVMLGDPRGLEADLLGEHHVGAHRGQDRGLRTGGIAIGGEEEEPEAGQRRGVAHHTFCSRIAAPLATRA